MVGSIVVVGNPIRVAASPITGIELTVLASTPLVLAAEPGEAPDPLPAGRDSTFESLTDEPSSDDIDQINEIISVNGMSNPATEALGTIPDTTLRAYLVHDVDETGAGESSLIVVGFHDPSAVVHTDQTDKGSWAFSASRGIDGNGWTTMRVPNPYSHIQIEVDCVPFWQRPADGFVWIPLEASPDVEVLVAGHDATGRVMLKRVLEPISERGMVGPRW